MFPVDVDCVMFALARLHDFIQGGKCLCPVLENWWFQIQVLVTTWVLTQASGYKDLHLFMSEQFCTEERILNLWVIKSLFFMFLNVPCCCDETNILPSSESCSSIQVFKNSLCVYSSSLSSGVSPNIVAVWELMMFLRLNDNAHLLIADGILVIPIKPPRFFPVAFSHSVLWSTDTWLNCRSVRYTMKLPSWNS